MAEKTESPKAEPSLADVRQDLEQLRADFARLLETVGKTARETAKGAAGEAEVAVEDASEWAEERYLSLRETIREQPVTACLVAGGLGLLLGQILLRR